LFSLTISLDKQAQKEETINVERFSIDEKNLSTGVVLVPND